jgi:AcrR family transcriptional regulator
VTPKGPPPQREQVTPSFSFVEYLETQLREAPPRQKGARTRERLKIATAMMLEEHGYHAMRVTDITEAAGVANGSFYVYFKDMKEASLAALSAFLRDYVDLFAPPEAVGAPFDSIRAANRRWFAICRANAGLMRCVHQLGDEDADFAALLHRTTRETYLRISSNMRLERGSADGQTQLLGVYLMGSMMDELVRKLIVFPDREFLALLPADGADDAIADVASLIWIRIFNPTVEPPDDLVPLAARMAEMMWVEP